MTLLRDLTLIVTLLCGTLGLSQIPLFVQEYEQRLGGALQEVRRQLDEYRQIAAREGASLGELIGRFETNNDEAVRQIALSIGNTRTRVERLTEQAEALASAGRLTKPVILARVHDQALLQATWRQYRMTMTLDVIYGAIGAALAWLLNGACWGAATRFIKPRASGTSPARRRPIR